MTRRNSIGHGKMAGASNMATPSFIRVSAGVQGSPVASPGNKSGKCLETPKAATKKTNSSEGVVINELLCFVSNKMDIMPYDTIVKLCMDVYNDEEVEDAKTILFDLCMTESGRRITRKGTEKRKHNLHDILNLLHKSEPNDVPCFAARDLSKLPPIHYNHMDMSVILKEMEMVKGDITELKIAQLATLEICRDRSKPRKEKSGVVTAKQHPGGESVHHGQMLSVQADPDAVGTRAGANGTDYITDTDDKSDEDSDGEVGLEEVAGADKGPPVAAAKEKEDGELDDSWTELKQLVSSRRANVSGAIKANAYSGGGINGSSTPTTRAPSFAKMAADLAVHGMTPGPRASDTDEEGFRSVTKRKKPVVIGTAKSAVLRGVQSGVKYLPQTAAVFVTRLAPGTKEEDVSDYVRSVFGVDAQCESLNARYNTYTSFKVVVNANNLEGLMNPMLWPEQVLVRKFFVSRKQ
jgi:hypothetical protein